MKTDKFKTDLKYPVKSIRIIFVTSIFIWMTIFWIGGVGIGHDISLTFSDAYQQYLPFHSELREIILNKDWGSFLYHWELGLGSSFFGVYSYYLSSPFVWLSLFFETTQLPLYFYLVILLKVGLSSIFAFIFFKSQPNVTQNKAMLFSVLYACIGAMVDRFYNVMWLDAIMLLPLTIWSLQRLIHLQRWKGFFGCLIYLFWTNFYMAYMVGIFCFFWFCLEVSLYHRGSIKEKWKLFGVFIGCAGLAVLVCGILLWSTLLLIKENSYSKEIAFEETHHLLQSLSDFFVGSYNGIEVTASGNIYITLFGLLMAISFFFNTTFSKKERLLFGGVITFFFASFSIPLLDWIWHGFKMPVGFPNRYAFLLSFLLLYLGCRSFSVVSDLRKQGKKCLVEGTLIFYFGLIGFMFLATFLEMLELDEIIDSSMMAVSLIFGILYSIVFFFWVWRHKCLKGIRNLFVITLFIEIVLNGYLTISQLKDSQKDRYSVETEKVYFEVEDALKELEWESTDRFSLFHNNANVSLLNNIKTLENFNTLGHRQTNLFLHRLYYGVNNKEESMARNAFEKTTISLGLDSLFGIKYYYYPFLQANDIYEFGWLKSVNGNWLENPYQLPLAFKIDETALERIDAIEWGGLADENQEAFFNALLGLSFGDEGYLDFAIPWDVEVLETENLIFNEQLGMYSTIDLDKDSVITFNLSPPEEFRNDEVDHLFKLFVPLQIEVNNGFFAIVNQFKTISFVGGEEEYPFSVVIPKGEKNRVGLAELASVDNKLIIDILKELKQNELGEWKLEGPNAELSVDLAEEGLYWLSIPYSPNWVATIDGEEVPLLSIQEAFMAIKLPKGQYTLSLTYHVPGLETGIIISVIGILLFGSILIVSNRRKK